MGAMPDTGRGRYDTQPSERRIARRHAVSLELEAKIDGRERMIGIRDISSNGFMAETHPPLILNEQFEVTLPHGGATRARAVWAGGSFAGCTFEGSISRASVSAALLQGEMELAPLDRSQLPRSGPGSGSEEKFSPPMRAAIILGAASVCWVPVFGALWLLLGG